MEDFAAIDFETANNERTSVCSVGVVIVRNGEIVDSFYSLIQPEPNYYNYWCSQVHGLTREDTEDAPVFPKVWKQIEPLIEGLPLVAHNKAFDESCLKAVFRWTIRIILSIVHVWLLARLFHSYPTINYIQYQNTVVITSPIIIMPSPMQRPAPGLQEKSCSYQLFHATLLYSYKNKRKRKDNNNDVFTRCAPIRCRLFNF